MSSQENSLLRVYEASAGSGKTHTLTRQYLSLILSPESGAYPHRRVQAVTFTNKATAEMKERIMKELFLIASGSERASFDSVSLGLSLLPEALRQRAKEVLQQMISDYSSFRVRTIDSFFQEVLRSFTHELGIPSNYRLDFEDDLYVSEAISRLISEQDEETSRQLARLTEEQLEDGKGFDARAPLKRLSGELSKEEVKLLSQGGHLPSSEEIARLAAYCREQIQTIKDSLGQRLQQLDGLDEYLATRGLNTWLNYILQDSLDEAFSAKNINKATIRKFRDKSPELDAFCCYVEELAPRYYTCRLVRKNLHQLGLLSKISKIIREDLNQENALLISDTNSFIQSILEGSSVPFIYEKIGAEIRHHMIDEFQDTSRLQYDNFRPLLLESLSLGGENLIVGDVKQSIYRFRNGDSRLLKEQVPIDYAAWYAPHALGVNWRSLPAIVRFNNYLFKRLPQQISYIFQESLSQSPVETLAVEDIPQRFVHYYQGAEQQIAPSKQDKGGQVVIKYYQKEDAPEAMLPELLLELQRRGYQPGEVAILVRKGDEATRVAEALLSYQAEYKEQLLREQLSLSFVSAEALILFESPMLRLIVATMGLMVSPQDKLMLERTKEAYRYLYNERSAEPPLLEPTFIEGWEEKLRAISTRGLYEAVEGIVSLYSPLMLEGDMAYLVKLLDLAASFQLDRATDISSFYTEILSRLERERVISPEDAQAFQLMTIHKAKGLGFRVVLLPFLEMKLVEPLKRRLLWCTTEYAPFDIGAPLPIEFNSYMAQSYFSKDYYEEAYAEAMDVLNLFYVATTRAKDELYLWLEEPKETKTKKSATNSPSLTSCSLGSLIYQLLREGQAEATWLEVSSKESMSLMLGQLPKVKPDESIQAREQLVLRELPSYPISGRISILRVGLELFQENEGRERGLLLHDLLGKADTLPELEARLEDARLKEILPREELAELKHYLLEMLSKQPYASWFDGSAEVLKELPIIGGELTSSRRPDRVMIYPNGEAVVVDYKFGDYRQRKHYDQVREYMLLIKRMGYRVKGYLWYISRRELLEVVL